MMTGMQPRELDQGECADGPHIQRPSVISRRRARIAVVTSLTLWTMFILVYAAHLLIPHLLGDLACEYPAGSSNYGHASWQWWLPGTSCSYGAADLGDDYAIVTPHTDYPSVWSGAALITAVGWPGATLLLRHRYARRRP